MERTMLDNNVIISGEQVSYFHFEKYFVST